MLALIWTNFTRKKGRLALTLLSVLVAFLLFGMLMAARTVFSPDLGARANSRLLTHNKVAMMAPLPIAYAPRIRQVPGVKTVSYMSVMLGWYQDKKNRFAVQALPADSIFDTYPELRVAPEQKQTWIHDRNGALVSPALLKAYGWKVGQRVPVMSTVQQKDGGTTWQVTIDGTVVNGEHKDSKSKVMAIHYKYLNEGRVANKDTVMMFLELPDDPGKATTVAQSIDHTFENAAPQTKTSTAKTMVHNAIRQAGDIGGIIVDVAIAVFFSMLLVIGAIMFQSARERRTEFAALRAIGFSRGSILRMVVGESLLTCLVGGLIGIGLAALLVGVLKSASDKLPQGMDVTGATLGIGIALMIAFGLVAAAAPARQLWRMTIREALGRG